MRDAGPELHQFLRLRSSTVLPANRSHNRTTSYPRAAQTIDAYFNELVFGTLAGKLQ
jgi:hypothetical protein